MIWYTFMDKHSRTIGERAVNHVRVASDPTHIRGTPVHFTRFVVEHIFMGHRRINHVAASGVQYALGITG